MPPSGTNPSPDAPAHLRGRFELAHTDVSYGGRDYRLLRPRSVDDLISEEDFAIDERIPYWADCWPSARVLAQQIAGIDGQGLRVLDLGCGVGLLSLVAAAAGCEVLATDYYAEALEFTAANAERHGLDSVDTRLVDWRKLPEDLGTFDLVIASDVLYERTYAALVADVLACTLAPGGRALLSDPGRRTAEAFLEECRVRRLTAECVERVPTTDGTTDLIIFIYEVRPAAASAAEGSMAV